MNSNRKIYWILSLLALGSFAWIGYQLFTIQGDTVASVCMFKTVTSLPCPSCGITRSVLMLLQGELWQALLLNPMGILAVLSLAIIPIWITYDLTQNKTSLLIFYKRSETIIRSRKIIYIPLIALVALNWIWNISKGL